VVPRVLDKINGILTDLRRISPALIRKMDPDAIPVLTLRFRDVTRRGHYQLRTRCSGEVSKPSA
jgi:hypothetical protein